MKKVLILGASPDSNRYSHKAMKSLLHYGHDIVLVSPRYDEIEGHKCYRHLKDVNEKIDVMTMYVGAQISTNLIQDIVQLAPRVVIFNPGSENPLLYKALEQNGIEYLEACTLVLLNTHQFNTI